MNSLHGPTPERITPEYEQSGGQKIERDLSAEERCWRMFYTFDLIPADLSEETVGKIEKEVLAFITEDIAKGKVKIDKGREIFYWGDPDSYPPVLPGEYCESVLILALDKLSSREERTFRQKKTEAEEKVKRIEKKRNEQERQIEEKDLPEEEKAWEIFETFIPLGLPEEIKTKIQSEAAPRISKSVADGSIKVGDLAWIWQHPEDLEAYEDAIVPGDYCKNLLALALLHFPQAEQISFREAKKVFVEVEGKALTEEKIIEEEKSRPPLLTLSGLVSENGKEVIFNNQFGREIVIPKEEHERCRAEAEKIASRKHCAYCACEAVSWHRATPTGSIKEPPPEIHEYTFCYPCAELYWRSKGGSMPFGRALAAMKVVRSFEGRLRDWKSPLDVMRHPDECTDKIKRLPDSIEYEEYESTERARVKAKIPKEDEEGKCNIEELVFQFPIRRVRLKPEDEESLKREWFFYFF